MSDTDVTPAMHGGSAHTPGKGAFDGSRQRDEQRGSSAWQQAPFPIRRGPSVVRRLR